MSLCLKLSDAPTLLNQFPTETQNQLSAPSLYFIRASVIPFCIFRAVLQQNSDAWLSLIEERTDPPCCCRRQSDAFNKKRYTSRRRPPTRRAQVRDPQCFLQGGSSVKATLSVPSVVLCSAVHM